MFTKLFSQKNCIKVSNILLIHKGLPEHLMETKRSIPFVNLLTSWLNALVKPYFMFNFSIYAASLFLSYPVILSNENVCSLWC